MEHQEFGKETSLKEILGGFIRSYEDRDRSRAFSGWLEDKLRQEMPDMPQEAGARLAGEILEAVASYDRTLDELNSAIDAGQSKEEWLAERLSEVYADMPLDLAGERLGQVETDLIVSNMPLMQGIGETQAEAGEISDSEDEPLEWNEYSVKNKAYEIGDQVILTGTAVAANVIKERTQGEEAAGAGDTVMETLQDGLKRDSGEVKAVVAGAIKTAAEKGLADIVPKDTPTSVIADMAGAAVESAEALSDVAKGKSTVTDAMDKIGRAGIAAGCRCVCDRLRGTLSKVPVVGPALVDLAGGLLDHLESSGFAKDVYTTVRNTAVATWEGVKKSRIGRAVGRVFKRIFG